MIHLSIYIIGKNVVIPTVGRTVAGFWLEVLPVEVVPVNQRGGIEAAVAESIRRGNPVVPTPPRSAKATPVVVTAAKCRSWSEFVRNAKSWRVEWREGAIRIVPDREVADGALSGDQSGASELSSRGDTNADSIEIVSIILGSV